VLFDFGYDIMVVSPLSASICVGYCLHCFYGVAQFCLYVWCLVLFASHHGHIAAVHITTAVADDVEYGSS
jgi:hypothetical protein